MAIGAGTAPAPHRSFGFSSMPSPAQAARMAREAKAARLWPGSPEWAERHAPTSAPEASFEQLVGVPEGTFDDAEDGWGEWSGQEERPPGPMSRLGLFAGACALVTLIAGAVILLGVLWTTTGVFTLPPWFRG